MPKVSILVHDISSNILWAATALAQMLQERFAVQVVGPDLGGGVCEMYRDVFPYEVIPTPRLYRFPDFFWERGKLARAVTGDVVIAMKAYMDTVPVALKHARGTGAKSIVYLDEWDSANYDELSAAERTKLWARHTHHPLDDIYFPMVERKISRADGVICASKFLASRFEGTIIPLGVDTEFYSPEAKNETRKLKRSLGISEERLIVFGGVVRPHKGVEEILEALAVMADESVRLLVVGPRTEFLQELQRNDRYAPYVICAGPKPKVDMPKYLALGDLVVLPLKDTPLAQSQVPCKVFEAMAMAKPIIASAVSDLPDILEGCGWIVPPDDPRSLAAAIRHAIDNPKEGKKLGAAARDKCIREYDRRVTSKQLINFVDALLNEEPSTINH